MAVTSSRNTQSHRWLSLPDGWDAGWKAARSAVGSSPAYVTVIGDSNAQGFQSTDHMTKPFPRLLRNALVAKYGSYGDYWPVTNSARFATIAGTATPGGALPWTMDATWGVSGFNVGWYGLGVTIGMDLGGTYPVAWNNAGSASFVTPYACTDMDIIWHDWVTATTWKYNVDNAAGANLVTVNQGGWNSMKRTPITGLANTTHTVRFGAPAIQYALELNGMVTYDPTNAKARGIGFATIGASGSRMYDWTVSPYAYPQERMQQLQGRYKTAAATEALTGFGFPTQPHLAIVELGINDCQQGVGLTTFRHGLRKMCDSLRRGRDNASILFLICPNPSSATSDQTTQFVRAESWSLYADQIYGIAAEYQCAVLNVHSDWMSTPVAQGYTTAGDAHPTDLGHQFIADQLASVIV